MIKGAAGIQFSDCGVEFAFAGESLHDVVSGGAFYRATNNLSTNIEESIVCQRVAS